MDSRAAAGVATSLREQLQACLPELSFAEQASASRAAEPAHDDAGALDLAPLIDHSLLTPTATDQDVRVLCEQALSYGFHAVCVHAARLRAAVDALEAVGSVGVACVIDFPMGAGSTESRRCAASSAVALGATELDLVASAGVLEAALPSDRVGSWNPTLLRAWLDDVRTILKAAREQGPCQLKLILETDRLGDTQIVVGALLAEQAGVDFVKTSTGFGSGGATTWSVQLLRAAVAPRLGIKASGGIRNRSDALNMIRAGATRLGTSQSLKLLAD